MENNIIWNIVLTFFAIFCIAFLIILIIESIDDMKHSRKLRKRADELEDRWLNRH